MKLRLTITTKLTLVFVLFAVVLVAVVGTASYQNGRAALEQAAVSDLLSTALEKQNALDRWVAEGKSDITTLATNPAVAKHLQAHRLQPETAEVRADHDEILAYLGQWAGQDKHFLSFMVIDPDTAQVITSTDAIEEGKFKEDRPYFIGGKTDVYVQNIYYSVTLRAPAMTVSTPVRAADGTLLGVLAGRMNLTEMNTIINLKTGLHQSDDAFLVNTSNLFVTQPRLVPDPAVLQRGIHTEAVNRCLATHADGVIAADDYRGVPSLIVYRWLPERDLCLIVKMDQAEAYVSSRAFGTTTFFVGALAMLGAIAIAFALARSITRPIMELQGAVARYGQGDLDLRLPKFSNDEIGVLAREFVGMTSSLTEKDKQLRAYAQDLEKRVEERTVALQEKEHLLSESQRIAHIGSWEADLTTGKVIWSDEMFRIYDVAPQSFVPAADSLIILLHPEDREAMGRWIGAAISGEKQKAIDVRVITRDGGIRFIRGDGEIIFDQSGRPVRAVGTAQDITERKRTEEALAKYAGELARSNSELEQFAYVASHDLQEPLRMVTSYLQLIERRYKSKLDSDADEFIAFAVDGASRMKTLIADLLAYSRVSRRGSEFEPVEMDLVLDHVLTDLQIAIGESQAVITHDPLPDVFADKTQIGLVLMNLIGNAIKFCGRETPRVHISATRQIADGESQIAPGLPSAIRHSPSAEWCFSIRDNGIGIDPQFFERIFIIFQRLHTRTEYPGTGMGLAICKKIIERHGGRIWVESQADTGSTFYFTLPTSQNPVFSEKTGFSDERT